MATKRRGPTKRAKYSPAKTKTVKPRARPKATRAAKEDRDRHSASKKFTREHERNIRASVTPAALRRDLQAVRDSHREVREELKPGGSRAKGYSGMKAHDAKGPRISEVNLRKERAKNK